MNPRARPARRCHAFRALVLRLLPFALGSVLWLGGCSTTRTLEIATDPPGATIWIDQVRQPETTPVTVPFTHYRYFDVRVEKAGYLPVSTQVAVASEIDGYPLVDLPFELLVRQKHFRRSIRLTPLPPRPGAADARKMLERARAFAARARREAAQGTPRR